VSRLPSHPINPTPQLLAPQPLPNGHAWTQSTPITTKFKVRNTFLMGEISNSIAIRRRPW